MRVRGILMTKRQAKTIAYRLAFGVLADKADEQDFLSHIEKDKERDKVMAEVRHLLDQLRSKYKSKEDGNG